MGKIECLDNESISGYDKNAVVQCELGTFLDDMIFDKHDECIFEILSKSNKIFKYKYSDGELLIDRVVLAYTNCLFSNDLSLANYYSRLIFNILKHEEYRTNKVKSVINDLRSLKSKLNNSDSSKNALFLIDKLSIIASEHISEFEEVAYMKRLERNYGIKSNFSSSIERIFDISNKHCLNYVDMRNKNIISMDHKFKVAYDDAISFEKLRNGNYLLGVYITDVASYVGMDTMLYEHARQRGESIYGDYNNKFYLPMFPREMTKDFFSLNSGSDKFAIAHLFEFSQSFDLVSHQFCNALINVKKNYSFENINRMNDNDSNYDMICILKRLSDSLSIDFNSSYHLYKEYGKKNIKSYDNGIGSNIISNVTVFLNTYIAELFKTADIPYIYRINTCPSTSISDAELKKIIKGSSVSSYSLESKPHPVNGGKAYGHITNPMRNFASYINQYIFLNTFIGDDDIIKIMKFSDEMAKILPGIVSDINSKLYNDEAFLEVLSELSSKCDVRKGNSKKGLTRRR